MLEVWNLLYSRVDAFIVLLFVTGSEKRGRTNPEFWFKMLITLKLW